MASDADPGRGELRVAVKAAGLNRADLLEHQYMPQAVAGRELAGEVIAVGEGVTGFQPGDRVMSRGAGFTTEATVPARHAMRVPDELSWREAGALPIALMTMHDALATRGQLRPGDRVLVHAATSGVGVTGVQLAALLGAETVFATSRSSEKLELLRAHVEPLQCELVGIDTSSTDFEKVATDVDVIIDNIGASVTPGNIAAAAIRGRIVQVGRLGGGQATVDLEELARKRLSLIGVTFRTRSDADVAEIVRMALTGVGDQLPKLRPRIERAYPLTDLDDAFDHLARNEHVGKLVVIP